MDFIDQLTKKVQLAAHEIVALKKERQQLSSEVELLRTELRKAQGGQRENDQLRRFQDGLRGKLEKLSKKLEKHLMSDSNANLTLMTGGNDE